MILKDEVQERIELLAIMAEECGELTQECMKIIRFGQNNDNITKEAGDIMCMIQLLIEKGLVNYKEINKRIVEKREKLKTFSTLTNL
jgi:NTP pyrophosphatase (non-canonical NTP hydrolase)